MKWYAYLNSNFPIYLTKVLAQASNNKAMEKGKEDSGVRVGVETVDYHRKRCNPLKLKKKTSLPTKNMGQVVEDKKNRYHVWYWTPNRAQEQIAGKNSYVIWNTCIWLLNTKKKTIEEIILSYTYSGRRDWGHAKK